MRVRIRINELTDERTIEHEHERNTDPAPFYRGVRNAVVLVLPLWWLLYRVVHALVR